MAEITLQIPEELFEQLVNKAATSHQPVDVVALQSLRVGMPPDLKHIPARFLPDLESLDLVDDAVLWQVARAELADDRAALYEELLHKNQRNELKPTEQKTLEALREEADLLMLRRSYAYALLKWRGHRIPTVVEMSQS
jgi:hypothetical protein